MTYNVAEKKKKNIASIEKETSVSLLTKMLKIRMAEEKIAELYSEQEMRCPTHLYIGQEAVSAGVCHALEKKDYVFSSYRSHGAYIAKGGGLKELFAEIYGKETGCSRGKGGSMHIVSRDVNFMGTSALVGGVIPIAAGTAFGSLIKRDERVTVVFFGDGAVEEGVFHETLNFAALKGLPVVFVCENNLYATQSHLLTRQKSDNIYQRSAIYNIPGIRVNGNDVSEVFHAAETAVKNARVKRIPALIECMTYRWLEHVGPYPDNDLGYRKTEEVEKWIRKCPVKLFENKLLEKGVITYPDIESIKNTMRKDIEEAVSYAKNSSFPNEKEAYKDVYR